MPGDSYHHGNLRSSLLREAARVLAEHGVEALSLRELARDAHVSHAAPAHHFGDKRGLLTALATEGFRLLTDALDAAGPDLLDVAVAYVRFATHEHPGHYEVMFRSDAIAADDPALAAARAGAEGVLMRGIDRVEANTSTGKSDFAPLAAFALVHGLATLWNSGAIAERYRDLGPEELARRLGPLLFTASANNVEADRRDPRSPA